MKDLCACPGEGCPLREKCLRYREVERGETVFWHTPYKKETKSCDRYVDSETIMKRKRDKVIDGTPYFNKR